MSNNDTRSHYPILIGITLSVITLSALAYFSGENFFQPYFGKNNPLVVIILFSILGFILLSYLDGQGWFTIYLHKNQKEKMLSLGLAALLAFIISLIDFLTVLYPSNINVLFPWSIIFYPAMGYVVEILFHIFPLTILLVTINSVSGEITEKWIELCLFFVSFLEPLFQISLGIGSQPLWVSFYVGSHILLINLLQLQSFKRIDFVTMYSFRLVYYLFWHIIWGHLRLILLF
jgi:hypothetical protein